MASHWEIKVCTFREMQVWKGGGVVLGLPLDTVACTRLVRSDRCDEPFLRLPNCKTETADLGKGDLVKAQT